METLAGITLYEPDLKRLIENIDAILPQVEKLICIDNGTKNRSEIKRILVTKYPGVEVIQNAKNKRYVQKA